MIGKINYGTGSLMKVHDSSELPSVGSESIIYYLEDTNTFVIWDSNVGDWTRLKTRQNMYLLDEGYYLNDKNQGTLEINISKMTPVNSYTVENPDLGDIVFDLYGASGTIFEKQGTTVYVRTQQACLTKKWKYINDSWEMYKQEEEEIGHYYWDEETTTLIYEGINRSTSNPIIYESYSINGGAPNFVTTGGTRIGTRKIIAWDGGAPGLGTVRHYYTKGNANDNFTSNDEVATIADVHSIVEGESGIFIGVAETEHELNEGNIDGYPTGHVLSENDWAYVMHYDENVKQYASHATFAVGDIIEYSAKLFKVEQAFTRSNWAADSRNCYDFTGTRRSFIYRTVADRQEWVLGMEVEQDIPFPDELRLTTDAHNKMTIKANGVSTVNIEDAAIINSKIADASVSNDKILDGTIQKTKLDSNLQNTITKAETCWYSENLVVSAVQPQAPEEGYILWIDASTSSL